MIKSRNPKLDRNSNDFRQVSNTNLKPATCSKCRACQQKQGFGHLRSRSTIAIKSRSNVFEKRIIFAGNRAILIDRKSSNCGEVQIDRISTNFDQTLIKLWSNLGRNSHKFAQNWDRNSIPSGDRNFDRILIEFGVLEPRPGTFGVQGSYANLNLFSATQLHC